MEVLYLLTFHGFELRMAMVMGKVFESFFRAFEETI